MWVHFNLHYRHILEELDFCNFCEFLQIELYFCIDSVILFYE